MATKEAVWGLVEPIVQAHGCSLFDLEVPSGREGTLRVFVSRKEGVSVDHCARIGHEIRERDLEGTFLPGDFGLEVSSPGVNRKLTRRDHFEGAVGERVRVTVADAAGAKKTFRGVLRLVDGEVVVMDDEETKQEARFPLSSVKKAQVDFLFTQV
jgi:ribosome maturation factor RimP